MRILMLDNEYPPLGGGMGTVNQALIAEYAADSEIEIDLVTAALGGRYEEEQIAERVRFFRVPVWNRNLHHSTNRELGFYAAQTLPLAIRLQRQKRYDICLAWSALPAGAVARALHWRTGLPYVLWLSGPDIPGFEQRYARIYPLLTPLIRATWRGAAAVIAKCDQEVTMVQAVDPAITPVIIPNGVDLERFQPGQTDLTGPLRVICVARLIERKGQQHLLAALARLRNTVHDVVVELVGTGDAEAALRAQADRLGIAAHVTFTGYVPREQIAERFAAAHVFVLPSFNEGLALAGLEALAAGLPLVLSRTGGTADLVAERVNGLTFDWGDSAALTAHLALLDSDRGLVRQMGAASRARAARFAWPQIAGQFLGLLTAAAQLSVEPASQR